MDALDTTLHQQLMKNGMDKMAIFVMKDRIETVKTEHISTTVTFLFNQRTQSNSRHEVLFIISPFFFLLFPLPKRQDITPLMFSLLDCFYSRDVCPSLCDCKQGVSLSASSGEEPTTGFLLWTPLSFLLLFVGHGKKTQQQQSDQRLLPAPAVP